MATVKTAYRFALDAAPAQEHALRSHAGAVRFAWNWGQARCKERYAAERKWYSAADLHRLWNAAKKTDPALAWWAENSKCSYQEAFRNLERALSDFVKSRKGLRKGRKLGFPRRKKKGKARDSFRLTGTLRCAGGTVTLPRLGTLRTHEATGKLAARYETVAVEDLNVTGMIANKKLARAVSDQGFGTARRMLAYKTARHGGTLLVADRWYPSSKTCSSCGSVKAKLTLKDRIYACDVCGHSEDRDVNAARNLLSLAASGAERVNARGAAVRPSPAGHTVVKREPGARGRRGKTGTAAPQEAAAA